MIAYTIYILYIHLCAIHNVFIVSRVGQNYLQIEIDKQFYFKFSQFKHFIDTSKFSPNLLNVNNSTVNR